MEEPRRIMLRRRWRWHRTVVAAAGLAVAALAILIAPFGLDRLNPYRVGSRHSVIVTTSNAACPYGKWLVDLPDGDNFMSVETLKRPDSVPGTGELDIISRDGARLHVAGQGVAMQRIGSGKFVGSSCGAMA